MDDDRPMWLGRFLRAHLLIARTRLLRDLAVWSDIRAFPPLAVLAGLNCVAGLILMRQRAAGLPLKMTNWRLCVAAVAAAGLTVASRWFLARIEREPPAFRIRAFLAAVSVFPLIVLLTVATPRNSLGAVGFVSLLAVAAGNANLLWNRRHSAPLAGSAATVRLIESKPGVLRVGSSAAPPFLPTHEMIKGTPQRVRVLPAMAEPAAPPEARTTNASHGAGSEWIERKSDERGQVLLRGKISAGFAAGQSLATVHIPFIPAFSCVPEFSCEIIDHPAVRARAPAVYRYGVRLELKRSGSAGLPLDVQVTFRATSATTARAA